MSDKVNNGNGNGDKPLRIVEFHARNIMAIKAVDIYPEGKDVIVLTGKNRQGKSTIIRAISSALWGKNLIPDEILKRGEDKGEVSINLDEFTVTLKVTPQKEYLEIKTRDGIKASSPQKFLNSRLADLAHNPLEFMRLKSAEQIRIVQGLFPLDVRAAEVERIAGLAAKTVSWGDNKVIYLDNVHTALFEERTENNREIVRLEKVIESIQVPRHLEDLKVVPVIELFEEKKKLERQEKENDDIRQKADCLRIALEGVNKKISDNDIEIADLEKKLEALRKKRVDFVSLSCELQDKYFAESDKIDELIEPDFTDIDARIKKVDADNEQANKVAQDKAIKQKSQEALNKARADSEKLTEQMGLLKAYKIKLIQQAALPLPGLGFEDGRVIYNGLPLDQASGREQIEISCAICLAQHPKIGIITIDVGWSELDRSGKEVLREFAQKTGAQIWVTQVTEEPGQEGFHIVDGELAAVDGVPVVEDCEDATEENTAGTHSERQWRSIHW